ncbi:AAA family ATPase [Deferrisoma sp.]
MRILAIRGENLASLEGRFGLEFEEAPLSRAGLFAITGPTGAGKSTILDALCLALFDAVPRLVGAGGERIGTGAEDEALRLGAGDVRHVLRRGAGEGWAEVDFVGADGRRYRARWAVRRARGRPDGRFQPQEMSLEDLETGQRLGGTRTETKAAIEEKVGLTFDQFRRSVLLAQGDFAAFLRAKPDERAALLERVTGTELYGLVSQAAHERAREERARLETLRARLGEIRVLADDERAAREEARAEAERRVAAARVAVEEARRAVEWHGARARLAAAVAEAQEELARAEVARAKAEPLRRELAEAEEAWTLAPLVAERDRSAAEEREAAEAVKAEEERRAELEARAAGAAAADEAAARTLADAEAEEERLRPEIDRAVELDTRLGAARERLAGARAAAERAEARHAAAAEDRARLEEEKKRTAEALGAVDAWREEHAWVGPVAQGWARWERDLGRYAELAGRAGELADAVRRAEAAAETARADEAARRSAWEAAREAQARAEERLGAAGAAAEGLDPEAVGGEIEALGERLGALERLAGLAERAAREAADEAAAVEAQARADREVKARDEALSALDAELTRSRAALEEAERALEGLRAALGLEEHRARLRPGEPCPLCGATEHPWAEGGAPATGALEAQAERVGELRAAQEDLVSRRSQAAAEREAWARKGAEAAEAAARHRAALEALRAPWAEGRARAGDPRVPEAPEVPGAAEAVGRIADEVRGRLTALRAEARRIQGLLAEREAARKAWDGARSAAEAAKAAWEAARGRAEEAVREFEALRAEGERVAREAEELLAGMEAAFARWPGWPEDLRDDPEGFGRDARGQVEAWRGKEAERARLAEALAAAGPRIEAAEGLLAARAEELARARDEEAQARAEVERLEGERAGVLGGRPVDEVRRELQARLARARKAREAAAADRERAVRELAQAGERVNGARERLGGARAARERAEKALADALAARGVPEERVRELLARGEAWVRQTRQALQDLDTALARARSVVEDRKKALQNHEAAGAPALGPDEAAAALEGAEAERRALEEERGRILAELRADDEARARRAELGPEIAAQEDRVRVWGGLAEVIGSHDGKKFRSFAQSLTLEVLLGHANHHLRDLAPRYRLGRVPGQDLALQVVDRHLGDEVRSVQSLSGGESFLVSLALALGLSSLASRQVQVESLFVDEGFGSLDPHTLDTVLEVLEALQASGRRIGVISHVPGMAERIGTRVEVLPDGTGRSRVRVVGAGG